jgi:hypothetical protein
MAYSAEERSAAQGAQDWLNSGNQWMVDMMGWDWFFNTQPQFAPYRNAVMNRDQVLAQPVAPAPAPAPTPTPEPTPAPVTQSTPFSGLLNTTIPLTSKEAVNAAIAEREARYLPIRQATLAEAQKLYPKVTLDDVGYDTTPQEAIQNSLTKLYQGQGGFGFLGGFSDVNYPYRLTQSDGSYSLNRNDGSAPIGLTPTGNPNEYKYSVFSPNAQGFLQGSIKVDPNTGIASAPDLTQAKYVYQPQQRDKSWFEKLGPVASIATAIFAPEFLPFLAGAQTAASGGDIGDILRSAATSYAIGQVGQQAGIFGDQAAAASQYGTDLASQQTAMLAAQEAGMKTAGDLIGNAAGTLAQGATSSALTGAKYDPLTTLASMGASAAAPMITSQIEGFSSLPSMAQNSINALVASEMTGKDPTSALISQALQAGRNAYQNYSLSDIANIGSNQLTSNNQGQPENIGILDSQTTQTQAPETQQVQNDVVTNTNLQDNQSTASGQGNSMADILDYLGGDTSPDNIDIGGGWNPAAVDTSFDNIDFGGGWNPAGNIYDQISQDDINAMADVGMNTGAGADLNAMGDVGMGSPSGGGTSGGLGGITGGGGGTSAGGTALASLLKGMLPTSALGKAALASGVGGVLQGLIGANASNKAAQLQADAAAASRAQQLQMFNTLNQQQAPYRGAGYGALNQIQGMLPGQYTRYDAQGNPMGMATGTGYLTQQFTPEMFQQGIDPGYAFRLQQGQMANQRLGNVSGGGLGGNVMRGLQDYTQGQASQEFGNAFNRFQTQRSNIYNTLAGIAGIGQTSQQQANTLGTNLANAQTNLNVGQAGAQAAGQIGQAGAYSGALGGINQALLLSQLPDIAAAMKGQ